MTWYVNGAPISASGNELDGSVWFDKDDEIVASVVPFDGDTYGDAMESDGLVILNTAPQAPEVRVSPALATEGEDLVCAVVTESEDVDGDSITYSFSWTQDGLPYGGATTTSESGDTVPGTDTSAGELWICTVTPHDGDEEGAEGSAQRAIDMGCRDLVEMQMKDPTITSGTTETLTLDSTTLVTDATAGDVSLAAQLRRLLQWRRSVDFDHDR